MLVSTTPLHSFCTSSISTSMKFMKITSSVSSDKNTHVMSSRIWIIEVWITKDMVLPYQTLQFDWCTVPTAMPGYYFFQLHVSSSTSPVEQNGSVVLVCVQGSQAGPATHLCYLCSEVWNFKLNSNGRSAFSLLWWGNDRDSEWSVY